MAYAEWRVRDSRYVGPVWQIDPATDHTRRFMHVCIYFVGTRNMSLIKQITNLLW